ncbi:hypothetical protein CNMCM5793_005553 [Aspergillus hiratsukae]|uniref:RNA-directed DNA polymerase n=1 Tax=Aspergillus hiratsukae TaxID=1194566 RepID=A0A8H6UB21_9EURO|nr:hypothetical protein CNMCM5793_005553 [Aspergillus hiratsukae]KAF7172294.1 hypothetical protein CNMCM6106_006549 [Aspergillus hiratsukae]
MPPRSRRKARAPEGSDQTDNTTLATNLAPHTQMPNTPTGDQTQQNVETSRESLDRDSTEPSVEEEAERDDTSTPSAPQHPSESATQDPIMVLAQALAALTNKSAQAKELKMPNPPTFHGKSLRELNNFLQDLDDRFSAMPSRFPSDDKKIVYATGFLTERIKQSWRAQRLPQQEPATWSEFEDFLRDFVEPAKDRGQAAAYRLLNLQSSLGHWREHMTNGWEIGTVNAEDPWRFIIQALILTGPPEIKDEITKNSTEIKTMQELEELGARLEKVLLRKRRNKTSSESSGQRQIATSNSTHLSSLGKRKRDNINDAPMNSGSGRIVKENRPTKFRRESAEDRKKREEKREKQRKEGRCFNCNEGLSASEILALRSPGDREEPPVLGDVKLRIGDSWITAKALLDTGAKQNFISYRFLIQNGVAFNPNSMEPPVCYPNGTTAPCYSKLQTESKITDWDNVTKEFDVTYNIIDLETNEYQVILGRRWLCPVDPDITLSAGTWRYRTGQPKIKVERPERFVKTMRQGLTLMMIYQPEDTSAAASEIPHQYRLWERVFSEEEAASLPDEKVAHEIPLVAGKTPPYGRLYSLSQYELQVLREYIDKFMKRGWIRPSTSPAGAPVLFTRKADGSLRLCVDYRGLNDITVKNRYPLPRIDELMDRLVGARYFTKLDLRDAYHRIRIKRGDEWKTAFRTRYGHFEYLVMPFGLTNAPATFQAYINEAMKGILDDFCIVYLDDILIYSQTEEEHVRHVSEVLERLQRHNLYAKLSKCSFHQTEVKFLGFIVGRDGVRMDPDRVKTVQEWPEPRSFRDVQVFLGFTGYFRRFIHQYADITAPLTNLLRGMEKGRKPGPFHLTDEARVAFAGLKEAFARPPALRHYDPKDEILVVTDASGFAIAGILLQPDIGTPAGKARRGWQPVAFFSRKLKGAELRFDVHDQELLAIVECFKVWRHYLEGSPHAIRVQSDHENLKYFFTAKKLNSRQARWAELLAAYDFKIEYKPGHLNPADAPSRRWDYEPAHGHEEYAVGPLPTLQRKLGGSRNGQVEGDPKPSEDDLVVGSRGPELLALRTLAREAASNEVACDPPSLSLRDAILEAQKRDAFSCRLRARYESEARKEGESEWDGALAGHARKDRWHVDSGMLWHGEAIYVPPVAALRHEIMRVHHDDPYAGHFGREKTLELIRRKFFWGGQRQEVEAYVKSCPECQKAKVPRRLPAGELSSLPVPERPWQDLTMDFIVKLPPSPWKGQVYDAILVIVDRYTKAARYLPTTSDINAEELADLFITEIVQRTGAPRSLVTDRGTLFTSQYWSQLCQAFRIKGRLSTAFHPQTDGQTERQNQTLETYLRTYTNYQQNDWAQWLGTAEFAYNNSKNASTGFSPFEAWYGYRPALPEIGDVEEGITNASVEERLQRIKEVRERLEENLQSAIKHQADAYNQRHRPVYFHVGQKVLLSTKNLKSWRPSKKLDMRYDGPFEVIEVIGKQAYRLRLPQSYARIHPVFHVSLLKPWTGRVGSETPAKPQPIIVDGEEEWEVERILADRTIRGQKQYLVKWKGWPSYENSWQTKDDLKNAQEALDDYLQETKSQTRPRHSRKRGRHM